MKKPTKNSLIGWGIGVLAAVAVLAGITGPSIAQSATKVGSVAPTATASSRAGAAKGIQDPVADGSSIPISGVTATSVTIPDIGVSSDLESLGLDGTGALLPPVDYNKAGWYSNGVLPGQVGPAIIAGHVDSPSAVAIFQHLDRLQPGMKILVTLSTGATLTFQVSKSEQAPKTEFPTSSVYGNVPTPQLRLITCGGPYDGGTGHYTENLVVFADLVAS